MPPTARKLPCRCQSPAWASPLMPCPSTRRTSSTGGVVTPFFLLTAIETIFIRFLSFFAYFPDIIYYLIIYFKFFRRQIYACIKFVLTDVDKKLILFIFIISYPSSWRRSNVGGGCNG